MSMSDIDMDTNSEEIEQQQQEQQIHNQIVNDQPKKPPNYVNKNVVVCGETSRMQFDICDCLLSDGISKLAILESELLVDSPTLEWNMAKLRLQYPDKEILIEKCDYTSQIDIKSKLEKIAITFKYIIDYYLISSPIFPTLEIDCQILLPKFFHILNLIYSAIDFYTEAINNNLINNVNRRFIIGSLVPVSQDDDPFHINFPISIAKCHAVVGLIYSLSQHYKTIDFFNICYQYQSRQYENDKTLMLCIIGAEVTDCLNSWIVHLGSIDQIISNCFANQLKFPL